MVSKLINEYNPDYVSIPGETILELLDEYSMTQSELATRMGRPEKTISNIINGKTSITSETALQLEKVFNVSTVFWLNLQSYYDEYLAKQRENLRLNTAVDWVDEFPVRIMQKFGWIKETESKVEQVDELLRFFGVATPNDFKNISAKQMATFRLARTYQSNFNDIAVWLRKGEIQAKAIYCQPYNRDQFIQLLKTKIRALTLESPRIYQHRLKELCATVGVAVVFVPQLPKAHVSGATRWLDSKKALIQLSLRYKTDDQLWFTFFHEAGHIIVHGKTEGYLEESIGNGIVSEDEKEAQVDKLAADLLIPRHQYLSFVNSLPIDHYPSKEQIIAFAGQIGIAPSIVVGRLQHDKLPKENPIPFSHYNGLKTKLDWK